MRLSPAAVTALHELASAEGMPVQEYVVRVLTRHAEVKVRWLHRRADRCANGHIFTFENTYVSPDRRRGRQCRTCHRESRRRAYYARTEGKVRRVPGRGKRTMSNAEQLTGGEAR